MNEAEAFKGRVLVLGGRGMLGRQVATAAREAGYQVWVAGSEIDIANFDWMRKLNTEISPHYVVNCAGRIPERSTPMNREHEMMRTNGLGPWVAREAFMLSCFIHISTDCVFDGSLARPYHSFDRTTPYDRYSWSKAAGEVDLTMSTARTFVVRTSFIGFEHGLLAWLIHQKRSASVPGWSRVQWSGATVYDVADGIIKLFDEPEPMIVHLSTEFSRTKYTLLQDANEYLALGLHIDQVNTPRINRALTPTHLITLDWDRLSQKYAQLYAHVS